MYHEKNNCGKIYIGILGMLILLRIMDFEYTCVITDFSKNWN